MDQEQRVPDPRDIRAEERLRKRLQEKAAAKHVEQAKEELYDQMVNPHLYGTSRSGHRRLKPGEHYEEVQKKELEEQIRMRERLEHEKRRQQSIQRRDSRPYDHKGFDRSRSRENTRGSRHYDRESSGQRRDHRGPRNESRPHDNPRYRLHDNCHDGREEYRSRKYQEDESYSYHRRVRR